VPWRNSTWWAGPFPQRCAIHSILIIDDEEQIRSFFRRALEEAGYWVIEARDGREGLRQLGRVPVDLVITDLLMPDMDGLEVTIALQRSQAKTKVIAVTGGTGMRDFRAAAELLGAHRTLTKPVAVKDLLEAVQEELQEAAPRKEAAPHE
jgi:two-component system response regulator (stage 0 sporulation protein F)